MYRILSSSLVYGRINQLMASDFHVNSSVVAEGNLRLHKCNYNIFRSLDVCCAVFCMYVDVLSHKRSQCSVDSLTPWSLAYGSIDLPTQGETNILSTKHAVHFAPTKKRHEKAESG